MKKAVFILFLTSIFSFNSFADISDITTLPQPNPNVSTISDSMSAADTLLAKTVQKNIGQNEVLKGFNFVVSSHDGIITLNATVDTQNQADAAVEAAKATDGVKEVKSNIIVKTPNTNTM